MTVYTVAGDGAGNFLTIQEAANVAIAGDTVFVKNGTYNEIVTVKNSGSAGKYITFAAYPGHAPTIDGEGIDLGMDGGIITIRDKNYIRVQGLKIFHSSYAGLYANTWGSVAVSHIEFTNNNIEDTVGPAVMILGGGVAVYGEGCIVSDNNIVNAHRLYPTQNHEVITIGGGQNNFQIFNNYISGSLGGVVDAKDGVTNGKIYNNTFTNNSYSAIYVDAYGRNALNIQIFGNKIFSQMSEGTDCSGINIGAEQAGGVTDGINIYNNLIYNNPGTALRLTRDSQGAVRNVVIANNTLYANGVGTLDRGGISLEYPVATNIIIRNNIIFGNGFAINNSIPNVVMDHNLMSDPLFASNGNDFHLRVASPAIDTGTNLNAPGVDINGVVRPQVAGYDIGAYEYIVVQIATGFLAVSSVPSGASIYLNGVLQ